MRSDHSGLLRAVPPVDPDVEHVSCSACGRTVDSDVLRGEQLLTALAWARIDGNLLCVGCREVAGRPANLIGRALARI